MQIEKISGISDFEMIVEKKGESERKLYKVCGRVFLVENKNTIEVRGDEKLNKLLISKYETVMESRYFGRGGIEIVLSGQLGEDELKDLVRLSYNLSEKE